MAEATTAATIINNPPATTTTTPPATTTTTAPPANWIEGLQGDLKGFVQEQGFKEPGEIAEQYRNLLKLRGVGADKLLRTPDSYTDVKEQEQAWNQIFDRLGRPKTAAEYGIENKEDADGSKFMADTFHKAGLTKTQAETIVKNLTERNQGIQKTSLENQQLMAKQSVDKLKQEWGATYDNNLQIAKRGATALGWDDKKVDQMAGTMGVGETIRMLNDVGRRVGEGTFITGNKGAETFTPDTAQAKIKQLMTDRSFTEKLMNGDAQAKAQWQTLHEQMGAGQNYA